MYCVVRDCRSIWTPTGNIIFHGFPKNAEKRRKWLQSVPLKGVFYKTAKICSLHFRPEHYDPANQKRLLSNAVPFSSVYSGDVEYTEYSTKEYVDNLLNKLTQAELVEDIRTSMTNLSEPNRFSKMVTRDLKCTSDASTAAHLWLIVKKQNNLNRRLIEIIAEDTRHVEILQDMEETRSSQKDIDQSVETYKYIVKCLQDKLATLEEQIEILTAV